MTDPEDSLRPGGGAEEGEEAEEAGEAGEAGEAEETREAEAVEAVEHVELVDHAEIAEIAATGMVEERETADVADASDELAIADASDVVRDEDPPPAPVAEAVTGPRKPPPGRGARPDLIDRREPLYRECKGYRLRLDPPDLARLRELPGSRGRSDDEIGEAFFDGQAERLASAIADDVPTPSEIRVVVDPYSRQAFLALENRIRGILSF